MVPRLVIANEGPSGVPFAAGANRPHMQHSPRLWGVVNCRWGLCGGCTTGAKHPAPATHFSWVALGEGLVRDPNCWRLRSSDQAQHMGHLLCTCYKLRSLGGPEVGNCNAVRQLRIIR